MFTRRIARHSLVALLLCIITSSKEVNARWALQGEEVPVERLMDNVRKQIEQEPENARAHYVLARLHSLAYARGGGEIRVSIEDQLPQFPKYESVQVEPPRGKPMTAGLLEHLHASIRSYREAVTLAPDEGLYHLGLAWMLDQAALRAADADDPVATKPVTCPAPTATTAPTTQPNPDSLVAEALDHYLKAIDLTLKKDLKQKVVLIGTDGAISLEASRNGLALMRRTKLEDSETHERLMAAYKQVHDLPQAITPIIFPLQSPRPLDELVDAHTTVRFDLAGDSIEREWPWVRHDVGILVWDPSQRGDITSGRQLFGSATWWMFWDNGYEALAALDNDGDGELRGSELDGIAVWQDLDGDASSTRSEVRPAAEVGIRAIDVRGRYDASGILCNQQGILMIDGRSLPSYDWIPISRIEPSTR